jgi:hypothetical protein
VAGVRRVGRGLTTFFDRDANAIAFLYDLSVAIPVLALAALIGSPARI